ncbi:Zn(2)-Cys(6) binuclear cluster domain-containing protein [Mycena galericulata]|nr:Zn(2)-Cys(6) binuclear cluster domain-containing protein [Mycena galericulata]
MSHSASSSKNPQQNDHLQRGQACSNCRRRKMRCDGARPVCGRCEHSNRPDDCEYLAEYSRSKVQLLQESIARVESRIYELEHPHEALPSITLHQPYSFSTNVARHPSLAHSIEPNILGNAGEPPANIVQKLLDFFLPYAGDFGFFLHVNRFRNSALMQYPLGHPARPAPAVLWAVYLWGLRLSNSNMTVHEPAFLARALEFATNNLSSTHPHKIMHTLQAEILLAYYFFASGRFVEGKYHTAAATALSVSSSLHIIRSENVPPSGPLPPPRDAVVEGERIHACWMTVILDNLWAAALRQEPARDLHAEIDASSFDTPWPLELGDYEMGRINPTARYSRTVHKFLTGAPVLDPSMSTITVLAKVTLLWQQSEALTRDWRSDMPPTQHAQAWFSALDSRIEGFRAALGPPSSMAHLTPAMRRTLIVAHSIGHAATIQLHRVSVVQANMASRRRRVSSACAVLDIVAETAPPQNVNAYINPIIGTVWLLACQAVMDEIRELQAPQMGQRPHQDAVALRASLSRAVSAMSVFSGTCALLKYQISRIQEAFSDL